MNFEVLLYFDQMLDLFQIYDTENVPKLNEVFEFIGILSCDPSLAKVTMEYV